MTEEVEQAKSAALQKASKYVAGLLIVGFLNFFDFEKVFLIYVDYKTEKIFILGIKLYKYFKLLLSLFLNRFQNKFINDLLD